MGVGTSGLNLEDGKAQAEIFGEGINDDVEVKYADVPNIHKFGPAESRDFIVQLANTENLDIF